MSIIFKGWFPDYVKPPEGAEVLVYNNALAGMRKGFYQSGHWWDHFWLEKIDVTAWTWPANSQGGKFLKLQEYNLASYFISLIINNHIF